MSYVKNLISRLKINKTMLDIYRGYGFATLFFMYRWVIYPHKLVERYIPKRGLIYDLGCGYGIFANYLALSSRERTVVGIEKDRRRFRIAKDTAMRRNGGQRQIDFLQGDVLKLDLKQCDVILINDVLHHIPSYKSHHRLFKICRDKLKEGGILVVVELTTRPLHKFLIAVIMDYLFYFGDKIRYRRDTGLLKAFSSLGFEVQASHLRRESIFPTVLYICRKSRQSGIPPGAGKNKVHK